MDTFIAWWESTIGQFLSPQLSVFFVSMIPLIEERGGLILAGPMFLNIPIWEGVFWCVLGNIVPIPFILRSIPACILPGSGHAARVFLILVLYHTDPVFCIQIIKKPKIVI